MHLNSGNKKSLQIFKHNFVKIEIKIVINVMINIINLKMIANQ